MRIEIKNLTKDLKGNRVLEDISMRLESGHIYGFQGTNGSGKTMLMRAVCGLIRPSSGEVVADGKRLCRDISFLPSVGVLIENPEFVGSYTAKKNLSLLYELNHRPDGVVVDKVLELVGLDPTDKRKFRKFSLGMKQRLGLAAALMEDPDTVILDEPFNALDLAGVAQAKAIITGLKKRGKLVILACHDKAVLDQLADRVFVIDAGRLVSSYLPGHPETDVGDQV